MLRTIFACLSTSLLVACTELPQVEPTGSPPPVAAPAAVPDELRTAVAAQRAFARVMARVEPVSESECRRRTSGVNCDFRIVVDDRPGQPPNAFQTLDKDNRPLIVFTVGLLEEARNEDELAFVMGHEAAHHIEGHIARQRDNALAGAVLIGSIATLTGATEAGVRQAQQIGATVGARTYSKEFELEADALGTVIAARAGYSPIRGAEFFNRIPDPGNRFLGTHPPNAARQATVRRVAAGL